MRLMKGLFGPCDEFVLLHDMKEMIWTTRLRSKQQRQLRKYVLLSGLESMAFGISISLFTTASSSSTWAAL